MTLYGVVHAHHILRALYIDILCMQLIKISNHEIMNHNLFIYLIECDSCVPVWTEDSSLTQSANNHLLLPSVNEC